MLDAALASRSTSWLHVLAQAEPPFGTTVELCFSIRPPHPACAQLSHCRTDSKFCAAGVEKGPSHSQGLEHLMPVFWQMCISGTRRQRVTTGCMLPAGTMTRHQACGLVKCRGSPKASGVLQKDGAGPVPWQQLHIDLAMQGPTLRSGMRDVVLCRGCPGAAAQAAAHPAQSAGACASIIRVYIPSLGRDMSGDYWHAGAALGQRDGQQRSERSSGCVGSQQPVREPAQQAGPGAGRPCLRGPSSADTMRIT